MIQETHLFIGQFVQNNHAASVVQLLIKKGCNADLKNKKGVAPIHLAAQEGFIDCLRALLDGNCLKDLQDSNGLTALHHAIASDKDECVELLIAKGCNLEIADNYKTTPLLAAMAFENQKVTQMILDATTKKKGNTAGNVAKLLG